MKTEKAVSAFLASCKARGLTRDTVSWYRSILTRFELKFKFKLPLTPELIEAFLAEIPGQETKITYFKALRAFYNFTASRNRLPNPFESVRAPKRRPKAPRTLSLPELGWLLAAPLSCRDRALVTLLIDTGARIGEALSLTREDIGDDTIFVSGKTGEREIPTSPETRQQLLELAAENGGNRQLFQGAKGPLTRAGAYLIIRRAMRSAGISGKKCGPHTLRHTFGRQYIMAGGDLVSLQRILGHSDIKTTRIYAELDMRDVTQQHRRFTPLHQVQSPMQLAFVRQSSPATPAQGHL